MIVSFVIPAYNELATITQVLDRVHALSLQTQIVAVDDGSTDGTAAAIEQWSRERCEVVLIRQAHRGKGAAIRAAIPHVEGEIVVIQDADLEYDPADVPALIDPIERGAADVVFGSRLLEGRPHRMRAGHRLGNRVLSQLTSALYRTAISDMETGYKVFRTDALRSLQLTRDDFAIEPELTGEVCRRRLALHQLPISYDARTRAEGKKITWRDGVRALVVLVRVRLRRRVREERQSRLFAARHRRHLDPAPQPK